jgi:hypothetical protein
MTAENPMDQTEADDTAEAVVEHVTVAEAGAPPPAEDIVATMTPNSTVKPSSFMTRWRADQWLAALLALLAPLALMGGLIYVFRDELRRVTESVGF